MPSRNPLTLLQERFGFDAFRPGQAAVIDCLLAGRSAGAIFPTGSGKSLCYQLPSLLLPGLTLVISPLLALMKDQIDALHVKGIQAERLDSSLDEVDYRRVTDDIRAGRVKLLFVAPERLGNERFLNLIRGQTISLLAVDEAHCISAWGHNFRPDYLKLADAAKTLQVERVLALTATATPPVAQDMATAFGITAEDMTNTGFYRPNLELRVTACRDAERPGLLVERLRERPAGATIVYVSLQRHAEEVAEHLQKSGFDAAAYHAGMASEKRVATQEAFMQGRIPIICATIAFGMGIDKADIRYIYHYHMSKGKPLRIAVTVAFARALPPQFCRAARARVLQAATCRTSMPSSQQTAQLSVGPASRPASCVGSIPQPFPPCAGCAAIRFSAAAPKCRLRRCWRAADGCRTLATDHLDYLAVVPFGSNKFASLFLPPKN